MRRTYAWALEAGFGPRDAELIARANLGYDARYPARRSVANITRHFAPWAWLWARHYARLAARMQDLMFLGYALHAAQDAIAHGAVGEKHLLMRSGLGRDPDDWEAAPAGVRRRIERATRDRLRRFSAGRG
jgi:hypothetical protein